MPRLAFAVALLLRGVAALTPNPPSAPPPSPQSAPSPSSPPFVTGAICDGVDLTDFSDNLLRGRHMVILETTYRPFGFEDADSPTGWSGFDLDLLKEVSAILGFTYDIKGMEPMEGESWDEMLLRTVDQGDLWMSWWARTASRMNQTSMLSGHVDISPVLAIPPPSMPEDPALSKTFTTFFDPFEWELWVCLFAMIFLSGVTDWLLERPDHGLRLHHLTASVYEYFGGVLFGGFSDPYTQLSCIYQCIVAFIILIAVAAYTANLASAMTISRQPEATFASIEQVIATKTATCVVGTYAGQPTIEAMYPSLKYDKDHSGWFDTIDDGIIDGSCECAVIPRIEFDTWLTEGPNCQLGIAGGSLFFASAGWVTNLNSTLCVQRSIEYAFHRLQANGVLSEILSKWLPPAACGTPVEVAGDADQSGRRLRDGEPGAPERPVASKRRQQRRRRLKGGSSGNLEPSSGANLGANSGSLVLTVEDFFGLFVVWCAATFLLLAAQGCRLIWGVYKKRLLAARGVTESKDEHMKDREGEHFPDYLDGDNTNQMLRFLRIWIALEEKGISFRYVEINPYETAADGSDTKTALSLDEKRNRYPEWIECSPRGLVPALEDGGVGVADSMVCLEYLEEVYRDRPLLPGAPGERARLRFWAVYANEKIIPHYYRLLMSQDTEGRERARAGLVDGLTEFASQMDPTGPYFTGAQFTWADLALAPWYERLRTVAAAYRSFEMPVDGVATARLERWYEAVRARPSVAATLANEAELVRNYAGYADDSATSDASRQFRGAV